MSIVKTFKLSELAEYVDAQLEGDSSKEINGIASLSSATSSQISFIARESYIKNLTFHKQELLFAPKNYQKNLMEINLSVKTLMQLMLNAQNFSKKT